MCINRVGFEVSRYRFLFLVRFVGLGSFSSIIGFEEWVVGGWVEGGVTVGNRFFLLGEFGLRRFCFDMSEEEVYFSSGEVT